MKRDWLCQGCRASREKYATHQSIEDKDEKPGRDSGRDSQPEPQARLNIRSRIHLVVSNVKAQPQPTTRQKSLPSILSIARVGCWLERFVRLCKSDPKRQGRRVDQRAHHRNNNLWWASEACRRHTQQKIGETHRRKLRKPYEHSDHFKDQHKPLVCSIR